MPLPDFGDTAVAKLPDFGEAAEGPTSQPAAEGEGGIPRPPDWYLKTGKLASEALEFVPKLASRALESGGAAALRTVRDLFTRPGFIENKPPAVFGQDVAPEPIQAGRSLYQPDTADPSSAQKLLQGLSTPGNFIAAPFASLKPVQAYFALQGAGGTVDSLKILADPSKSDDERRAALESLPPNALMALGGAAGLARDGLKLPENPLTERTTDAIPKRSAAPIPVEEPPGDREKVGEGVRPGEEPAVPQEPEAQAPVPAKADGDVTQSGGIALFPTDELSFKGETKTQFDKITRVRKRLNDQGKIVYVVEHGDGQVGYTDDPAIEAHPKFEEGNPPTEEGAGPEPPPTEPTAPPPTKPETALEKGIKSGFVTNEGLSVIPGLNAGEAALLGEILVDPSQQIPPEALSRLRNKLKQVKAKPPATAGPVLASGIDAEGDPYHLTKEGTYQRKGGKWQLTDAAGKKKPVTDADTIAKLEARAPKPPTEEPPPTEPTAPPPTTPPTEPTAPAAPAAEAPAREFEKSSGFTFNPEGVKTEGLTPEQKAQVGQQWEFTDKRAAKDSPTAGMSFYVPEGSTLEQIKAAHEAKLKAEKPTGETKPAAPATEAPVAETKATEGATPGDLYPDARNWVKQQSDAVKGFLAGRIDAYDRWKSAKGKEAKRVAKITLDSADRELEQAKAEHKKAVEQAYNEGKPVPADVLADYPDLAKGATPAVAPAAPTTAEKVSGAPPGPGTGEGPGSPAASEVTETGPRGEPTHGIAARVSEQRRLQGVIAPVEPGEGISPPESVEHGRALLEQGADPQRVLDEFNRTKAVTADGMAVVRAHGERLAKAAYAAADRYGIHSPEYEAAWEADSDWTQKIKPMQTEWHKIGQAQQGEVEIDTGTFHGLRRAFKDATGKDFTPAQADEAVRIAKGVKEATEAADKAKEEVFAQVGKEAAKPVEKAPPASKPGQPAKPQPITLWKRAKAILDAGETDFDAIRHKLAIEFGIPVEEVTRILAEPKTARTLTDDMYRKMSEQRRLISQAKNWLKNQEIPGWQRFIRAVPRVFFTAKIFGHGTVGMITHAGLNIFNPGAWRTYWPNFFRQYKLMVSPAYHERMMQDLIHDPLYTTARRAGLVNDAFRYQDDYQTPQMAKWLGRIGLLGNRGFDALKLFRQARFSQIWNGLPDTLKTKDQATLLADSVNHATGAINMRFREWANWTFFAPKLEGSRWAWMVKDPLNAAKTFLDWGNATPEQRSSAMIELKQKAAIAGTYYGLLALNQGLLSASGSDDKINFSNPKRGDFMAFKAAGHNVGIVSPMLGMVRLFANLVHATMGKRGKLESLTPRAGEVGQKLEEYARGKLSPFASFGADVVSQADFQGRPMPYSTDKTPAYLRRQGIGKYTYGQYAAQEFTPIPVSEAIREVWRDQGMNENDIDSYLKALLVGVVTGGTGARVSAETPAQKKSP